MCYNRVNGTYLSDNKLLLTDVLRKEWGFDGMAVGAVKFCIAKMRMGVDLEITATAV